MKGEVGIEGKNMPLTRNMGMDVSQDFIQVLSLRLNLGRRLIFGQNGLNIATGVIW